MEPEIKSKWQKQGGLGKTKIAKANEKKIDPRHNQVRYGTGIGSSDEERVHASLAPVSSWRRGTRLQVRVALALGHPAG